jgi:hypothetical protein
LCKFGMTRRKISMDRMKFSFVQHIKNYNELLTYFTNQFACMTGHFSWLANLIKLPPKSKLHIPETPGRLKPRLHLRTPPSRARNQSAGASRRGLMRKETSICGLRSRLCTLRCDFSRSLLKLQNYCTETRLCQTHRCVSRKKPFPERKGPVCSW